MGDRVDVISLNLDTYDSGLLCVTSPQLPEMVIVHRDLKAIKDDLHAVVRLIYRRRYNEEVQIREVTARGREVRIIPDLVVAKAA
jgi:hypothetical protein